MNQPEILELLLISLHNQSSYSFDEGRIVYKPDSSYFVETYLKDHLGNIRVAYANDGVKDGIRQVNAYYSFGMQINTLSTDNNIIRNPNEYKYNGKMFQDELGLNWLDYGARFYDPVVGRFHTLDRFAEKYLSNTSYNYGANNPILLIDVNGDSVKYTNESTKNFIDPIKGRYYLTHGCTKEYSNSSGLNYQVIYAPPYLNLKRR